MCKKYPILDPYGRFWIINTQLNMECNLYDTYDTPTHDVFIGEIVQTYADETVLTGGKVEISKVKPLLFDMSSINYWSLGGVVAKCWNVGKQLKK